MVESTVIEKEKFCSMTAYIAKMYVTSRSCGGGDMIVLFERYNSGTIIGHPDKRVIGKKLSFVDLSRFERFEGEVILKNETN